MKIAQFYNFTDEVFSCAWDGRVKKFSAGQKKFYPDGIAQHFAKHLTNSILNKMSEKDGISANYTSPKKPAEVPQYMNLFNKAYLPVEDDEDEKEFDEAEVVESQIRNRPKSVKTVVDNQPPQIITGPDGGPTEGDEEEPGFEK